MATHADRLRLQGVMTMYVTPTIPWDNNNPVKRALDDAGIEGFEYHLIPCKEAVLQHLEDPRTPVAGGVARAPLPALIILRIQQAIAFYHHVSCIMKASMDITIYADDTLFREFLVAEYDANTPLLPWKIRIEKERSSKLRDVKRSLQRPNPANFPILKEDKMYTKWLREFSQNLTQSGLAHTVVLTHTVEDAEIDDIECQMTMRILYRVVQTPRARQILDAYIDTNDTVQHGRKSSVLLRSVCPRSCMPRRSPHTLLPSAFT